MSFIHTIEESDEAVAFHKSSAAQGRLTKIEDIIPIVDLLVKRQHWLNGQVRLFVALFVSYLISYHIATTQTIYANGGK
jgi:hypothetical protein